MTFHAFLDRFRRIFRWSASISIGCFLFPLFGLIVLSRSPQVGMIGLNEHPFEPEKWIDWLLHVGPVCCLVSAVIAIAAGVTYLIGKTIAVPRARPPLDIFLRRP